MEQGFMEFNKEKQQEMMKMHREYERNNKRGQQERLLWESQRIELLHKNKVSGRKIAELQD